MVDLIVKPQQPRVNWYNPDDSQRPSVDYYRFHVALHPRSWRPPTDVYETEDAMVVRVEIAGMKEEDFTISLEDRLLLVRGIRPDTPERRAYHQMEIPFGDFSTEVELPYPVAAGEIEAIYRDGFLRIVLPKARPHQVQVEE